MATNPATSDPYPASDPRGAGAYTVLDGTGGGVRVQVEFQPRANLSLGASGIPFIRAIVVHNESALDLAGLEVSAALSVSGAAEQVWRRHIPGPIVAGSATRIDDPRGFEVFAPLLAGASESVPGTLDVTAGEARVLASVEISAHNEWLNFPGLHAAIGAFVQPNTAAVTGILRAASDLLLKRTGTGSLDGYQSGPERAHRIAAALYESLRARGITYINPPASFERTGQKVRTTEQVLAERFGTCIDLAVLYAAVLEACGLFPVVFITRNHAFTGFYAAETYGERATIDDVNVLTNLVEAGVVVPVELTGIGPGTRSLDFRDAAKAGAAYFRTDFHLLQTMVDVTRSRIEGVRPMASKNSPELSEETLAAERSFVARSSLKNLSLAAEEETVRGQLERQDASPARFKNWKRDLLDLTLRNPLLNMPHNQKVLDLLVPGGMLPLLDDVVHSGRSVRVSGGSDSTELQKLAGIRAASEIAPDVMTTIFSTTRTVFSALDDEKHRRQLRAMKREADTLEQESGSNYLYLTLGTLVHTRADGREARAPLFLLPVRLTGGIAFTPYAMKLDGGEIAEPNLCLLQWLKTTKGVELSELESPSLDDSGLAIGAIFSGIRRQLLEAGLPYRIDEAASLAILRFSTFQVWKDLDENWEQLMTNPVVRHLVQTPGETFAQPAGAAGGSDHLDETGLRLPIAADGSQMAAIVRATSGESFVLEGPPGTGKSQTITNLISHAITAGRKVLFVAEKQAALEVVKRRLDSIGIGTFGLELHGAKQSMNSIRDQLRAALETRVETDQAAWDATDARLRSAIVQLERYPDLVHGRNAQGHSLWSAYEAVAALGEGASASIPLTWLGSDQTADITQLVRDYSDAATRFGLRPGHHWLLSGTGDPTALNADAVRTALAGLETAHRRLAELPAPWRDALGSLRPAAGLSAAVTLATARSAGLLPQPGHLPYIDRADWREASAALVAATTAYRARHAAVLAIATPEAVEYSGLGELIEKSTALDGQWFFPELRRRSLRKRIEPLLQPGAAPVPEGAAFTAFLVSLRDALTESEPLLAARSALQGLLVPEPWRPYRPGAVEALTSGVFVSSTAVWLAARAPAGWALVAGPEGASAATITVLADLDSAWRRWLGALRGSQTTVLHWTGGGDWLDRWATDEPLWQRDLDTSGLLQLQRFAESRRLLDAVRAAGLPAFSDQLASVSIPPQQAPEALLRGLARASLEERSAAGGLDGFDADAQDRTADDYLAQGALSRQQLRTAVAARLIRQRPFDVGNLRGEVAELKRQIDRKRGGLAFREVARRFPDALTSIVPVFLMSPGSVAHFLDASSIEFDLVVFDEASQIRVPQAIGAMGRGRAVVVVGDSKQMPPTRLMQIEAAPESEQADAAAELVVEDLESILSEAVESGLPQLWLNWHYRSQDESLIAFSNAAYYDSKLVSLPSPDGSGTGGASAAGSGAAVPVADSGAQGTPHTARSGLSLRRVAGEFARGAARTNEVEAQAIVDEIGARLRDPATRDESIGVVCFNIQQRDLILNKLEDSSDLLVQRALTAEAGRDLFVKNLENVQGDERDTILFSLAFSIDQKTGLLPLNFGPLNLAGGERRLNVAVTRARRAVVLFASFDPSDIDLRRSSARGIADLKRYLEFADSRTLGLGDGGGTPVGAPAAGGGSFVDDLALAIRGLGYETSTALGLSSFKVDIAVRKPGDDDWRVAVIVDGAGWAARPTVSDRDGSPQLLVDLMGWPAVARVWLPAWLRDRDGVLDRIRAAVEKPVPPRQRFVSVAAPTPAETAEQAGDAEPAGAAGPAVATAEGRAPSGDADRQSSGIALPEFTAAADSAIANQSVLDNMRMAQPAIQRIAAEILATEGPIPLPRLLATVARRFGYTRIGEGRRNELLDSLRAMFTMTGAGTGTGEGMGTGTRAEFAWPAGVDPLAWRGARRSPSSDVRAVAEVSPEEVANVAELVVREAFSITRDDLVRETGEVLGYTRLSEQGRGWLGAGIALAVAQGRILDDGERMRPAG
jgi:hypothetical protein